MSALAIAAAPCGGGWVGFCACPGAAGRSVVADLAALRGWGATTLVTLAEAAELAAIGAPDMAQAARAAGLGWVHAPIPDFGTPGAAFAAAWRAAAPTLRRRLAAGGRVALHCREGLGRSGTIAALMLIEAGARPDAAIAAVRAARPGAIETAAQEAWLHNRRPAPPDGR